jgi:UDP:flavonoid glycosyltransferase YjiC (YdhE family)
VSPTFCPRPNDWPNWIQLTGFCFWDTPLEWTEPPELTAFLEGTTPVIAVSSGSLSSVSADTFTSFYRASVAAIQQIGARALVIGAPDETFSTPLPSDVYAVPFAPFSSVYPRCSAIIHHGGIGTTAQALRAGVPMLVVPWGLDQFFAGTRITQLGAGRRIDRHDLTASSVAAILRDLLEGEQYRTTAQTLAAQIAQEDGVEQLCTTLEAVLAQHSSTQQVLDAP